MAYKSVESLLCNLERVCFPGGPELLKLQILKFPGQNGRGKKLNFPHGSLHGTGLMPLLLPLLGLLTCGFFVLGAECIMEVCDVLHILHPKGQHFSFQSFASEGAL